jgi:galactofuranose transport system substrate-binding protein
MRLAKQPKQVEPTEGENEMKASTVSFFVAVVLVLVVLAGCAPAPAPAAPAQPTAAAAAPAAAAPAAATAKTYKDMTLCYPQLGAESDWRTANTASFKETAANWVLS